MIRRSISSTKGDQVTDSHARERALLAGRRRLLALGQQARGHAQLRDVEALAGSVISLNLVIESHPRVKQQGRIDGIRVAQVGALAWDQDGATIHVRDISEEVGKLPV